MTTEAAEMIRDLKEFVTYIVDDRWRDLVQRAVTFIERSADEGTIEELRARIEFLTASREAFANTYDDNQERIRQLEMELADKSSPSAISRAAVEECAKVADQFAEALDGGDWGDGWRDASKAIGAALHSMARSLAPQETKEGS